MIHDVYNLSDDTGQLLALVQSMNGYSIPYRLESLT